MGRKIPGRKHRGVKDPEQQAAVRFARIKNKINNPPSNPDDQQIPKSLQRVIDLKNKVRNGELKRSTKKTKIDSKVSANKEKQKFSSKNIPEKVIPAFKQNPGETDRNFVRRMNKVCMDIGKEVIFEEKYGVRILRNEEGEVEGVVKRPKDELELLLKKIRKEKKEKKFKKKKKKANAAQDNIPKETKSQKWQRKKKEKKLKKKTKELDILEVSKDSIKFGEIVHAPPTLTVPKKIAKLEIGSKPGKKGLLLKSLIDGAQPKQSNLKKDNMRKTINRTIDKKGKRKELPNALRRQLEKQQQECIEAYKQLKQKKNIGF